MKERFFQQRPPVRLRREAWGGIAFDRSTGELLELDAEGFDVLAALGAARTLRGLVAAVRAVRPQPLALFVQELEGRGFVARADARAPALPPDPWAEDRGVLVDRGLRAPLVAHWAVTYRCNLHCPFCYSESSPFREAGPDPAVRRHIVERLARWGVLEVALGGGEPTVLPDLPDLLAAIRAAGMVPNVTTNGTRSDPAVVRALAEHAGVVHLSADRPDRLDAARGPGVFGRLRETARLLRAAGARLGANLLLTPDHVHDLPGALGALVDLGVGQVTLLRPKGDWAAAHWPGFPTEADVAALARQLRSFLATRPPLRLYVDTALRAEWARAGLLDDPEPEVLGCGGGQRHVALTPEGDVYPCSHARRPEFRMGNLLADGPGRLWLEGAGRAGRAAYTQACAGARCPCRSAQRVALA